jgi:plastocyanin
MKYALVITLLILCTALMLTAACTTQQPAPVEVKGAGLTVTTSPQTIAHAGGPGATVPVRMKENSFDPSFLTIKKGTTVTWTNEDSVAHTVTYTGAGDKKFDSGNLAKGNSFSNTFNEPGRFIYACTQHGSMAGTIVVE